VRFGYLPSVSTTLDLDVLEFIGPDGKTFGQIEEQFPTFDVVRVIRAGMVEISRETDTAGGGDLYVLTERGASAVGLEPDQRRVA
jgi:hypothetical protein